MEEVNTEEAIREITIRGKKYFVIIRNKEDVAAVDKALEIISIKTDLSATSPEIKKEPLKRWPLSFESYYKARAD